MLFLAGADSVAPVASRRMQRSPLRPAAVSSLPSYHLQLFGPPRLLRDGAEVRLTVRKSLALLAVLAIEQRVERAKLAALFWGEADSAAARRNLRRELHRLREAGLADLLLADDATVAIAPVLECDVPDFVRALDDGRETEALDRAAGALMDGFELPDGGGFDDWLGQQRERLARRWAEAARAAATRLERQGDPRAALALVRRLVAREPLHESHQVHAMHLHEALGERAEALALYEQLRQTLKRELDLEPLPETEALAERLRAAERVAPLVTRGGVRGLARFDAPLIGRAAERAWLDAAWAAAGPTLIALIEGEAGVGKSRLATEFALEQRPLLRLVAREADRGAALQPLLQLLRSAQADPALRPRWQALDEAARRSLARLLPPARGGEPGSGGDGAREASVHAASGRARAAFVEGLADALAALVAGGALLIDDLQWLDEATLEVLDVLAARHAARASQGPDRPHGPHGSNDPPALRLVATARSAELADAKSARDLVRKLERTGQLVRRTLEPLAPAATLELVRELSGSAGGERFAERLQRVTRGNPFYMLETLRFLFDVGELQIDEAGLWSTRYDADTGDYRELPVPPTVQQAVLERAERLGPAARRVLETAALAGDPFTLEDVQPATALGEWDALDGLERAIQAQLVAPAEPGYRYVHDLAREALAGALRPERRRLIHGRLADALLARNGAPGRIAGHLDAAGRMAEAVPHHIAAAQAAEDVFAHREALAHYGAALAAVPAAKRPALHRARLALLRSSFDLDGLSAEADALQSLGTLESEPWLPLEAEIARIDVANLRKRHDEARRLAEGVRADARWPVLPFEQRLKALREHATALSQSGEPEAALALYDELLRDEAAAALEPAVEAGLHYGLAMAAWRLRRAQQAEAALWRAEQLFTAAGDLEGRARVYNLLAILAHQAGRTEQSVRTAERALADAERAQLVTVLRDVLLNLIKFQAVPGEAERADERLERARSLFAATGDLASQAQLASREAEVRRAQGRLGAALDAAARSIELFEANGSASSDLWPWYQRARLLWELGDGDGARETYRQLPQSPAFPRSPAFLPQATAAIDFYVLVMRLPAAPHEVLAGLEALAPRLTEAVVQAAEFDYYRAMALLLAGDAEAAFVRVETLCCPASTLHAANVAALRLRCAARAGRDVARWQADAVALLPTAPPLEALELRAALLQAALAAGDAAEGQVQRQAFDALLQALAGSLESRPALRAAFAHRWAASPGTGETSRAASTTPAAVDTVTSAAAAEPGA